MKKILFTILLGSAAFLNIGEAFAKPDAKKCCACVKKYDARAEKVCGDLAMLRQLNMHKAGGRCDSVCEK